MPQCLYDLWIRRFDAGWLSSTKIPDLHRSTRNRSYPLFRSSWPVLTLLHHPLTTSFVFQNSHSCMGIAPQAVNSGLSWIDHLLLAGTAWHSTSIWPLGDDRLSPGKAVRCKSVESCWVIVFPLFFLSLTLEAGHFLHLWNLLHLPLFFALWDCRCSAVLKTSRSTSRRSGTDSLFLFDFFLEIRPDLVTWAQRKAVSDCRHTAMSWLLCRTCALQTHAPKWLLRLSSHEADLQWCCFVPFWRVETTKVRR